MIQRISRRKCSGCGPLAASGSPTFTLKVTVSSKPAKKDPEPPVFPVKSTNDKPASGE